MPWLRGVSEEWAECGRRVRGERDSPVASVQLKHCSRVPSVQSPAQFHQNRDDTCAYHGVRLANNAVGLSSGVDKHGGGGIS